MKNVHFSSMTDSWTTPQGIYLELDSEFHFNFDPCPLDLNPNESGNQLGLLDDTDANDETPPKSDGLEIEWGTSTFCNPPYSQLAEWLKKAFTEWKKGKTVVMLVPSRTDTKAWHDYAMKATEIRFVRGRLKFGDATNSAPFPSAVVIFKAVA